MRQDCRLPLFDAKIRASIRVTYTRITDGSTPITEDFPGDAEGVPESRFTRYRYGTGRREDSGDSLNCPAGNSGIRNVRRQVPARLRTKR